MNQTPLYGWHVAHGAKMIRFHGWEMPVQYSGIHEEHHAVRRAVGLFDVSHMGRFLIQGPGAAGATDLLTTNWASRLAPGRGQYSVMCDPRGGIMDDLTVSRLEEDQFLLCVNASNRGKDLQWIQENLGARAEVVDLSEELAQLALQGSRAEEVLQRITATDLTSLPYFGCTRVPIDGLGLSGTMSWRMPAEVLVSRTGYTGEDGFELYLSSQHVESVWEALLTVGQELGIRPAGLGARDTLRLEMGYLLYGNDLSEQTTPLEAGLEWVVKWEKEDFIGKEDLRQQKANGLLRRLVGFELKERGIPRSGYPILAGGSQVGEVTSGNLSPSLGRAIGLGYVAAEQAVVGTPLEIEIRGRPVNAEVVKTPFYPRKTKKQSGKQ
ncbi:MAG: glycine cleavage system aminomethyltransferase GcvT [Candidatus Tectomicrobia bacterium]|uniref:Aminomethyltransferase n=1 Tax=Tectimicrobiota bacterium TaxID=2528274 RepID=A0A932FZP4_UNCTE|nr:glycine cleavage system aminomethyltransferase GcvT [Candidatus Tectomicrobia bacterium]